VIAQQMLRASPSTSPTSSTPASVNVSRANWALLDEPRTS
jgi:hypothetical protein